MTCLLPHREDRRALDGLYVCRGHYRWMVDALTDIVETSALLSLFMEPGSSTDDGRQVRSKRVDPPAPIRLDIVALTDTRTTQHQPQDILPALAVVESWARMIREERQLTPTPGAATLVGETKVIHTNLDWCAAQTWITDMHSELKAVRASLNAAIGEYPKPSVGMCPIVYPDSGACLGRLYQAQHGSLSVYCSTCGETWEDAELRRLGYLLGA